MAPRKRKIGYLCRSMSEPDGLYCITVTVDTVFCDCHEPEVSWCSHIEATMLAGERAMVIEEDRGAADAAMALFTGLLAPPIGWKAAWRKNMRWRGLGSGTTRTQAPSRVGLSGRPVVCFTGAMAIPRTELLRQAEEAGWEAIDSPHSRTTVLIAADVNGDTGKLRNARKRGIPILSLAEWETMRTAGEFAPAEADVVVEAVQPRTLAGLRSALLNLPCSRA